MNLPFHQDSFDSNFHAFDISSRVSSQTVYDTYDDDFVEEIYLSKKEIEVDVPIFNDCMDMQNDSSPQYYYIL